MGPEASRCFTLIRFTVNFTLFLCNVSTAFNDLAKVSLMKTGVRYKRVFVTQNVRYLVHVSGESGSAGFQLTDHHRTMSLADGACNTRQH